MDEESVIFEIQVEKKILEQIFTENKHLKDSYEKLVKNEDVVRALRREIEEWKQEVTKQKTINEKLSEENTKLKNTIEEIEEIRRINEEKSKTDDLEHTESKLLKMKLHKLETEKSAIVEEFEKEKKLLEELLLDKSKMAEVHEELKITRDNLHAVEEELKKAKEQSSKLEEENRHLDEDKLKLEQELEEVRRKLRLEEERNKSNDLEHVESKLLKLKLQTVENENQYLQKDFERERNILIKQNKPRVTRIEENLKLLRKWIEKEARERRPRDSEEVKMLKAQIQVLENDKIDLIEGFELERKVFQKILKSNGSFTIS